MKKNIVLLFAALMVSSSPAFALQMTFFGEDAYSPTGSYLNADAANADFLSRIDGFVGVEDFEGFQYEDTAPLFVDFGDAGIATLTGQGNVFRSSQFAGTPTPVPTSGDAAWLLTVPRDSFVLEFSDPVAAFGFYGGDIGDYGAQLGVRLNRANGTSDLVSIPHTLGANNTPDQNVLFWGIIDTENQITSLSFESLNNTREGFFFDDFTIASAEQLNRVPEGPRPSSVPEPSSMLLFATGMAGLVGIRKRKNNK
jgi:hypothetical protein